MSQQPLPPGFAGGQQVIAGLMCRLSQGDELTPSLLPLMHEALCLPAAGLLTTDGLTNSMFVKPQLSNLPALTGGLLQ